MFEPILSTIDNNGIEISVLELELKIRKVIQFGTSLGLYDIALVLPEPLTKPGLAWNTIDDNIFFVLEVTGDTCRSSCHNFVTMYMRPVVIEDMMVPRPIRFGVIRGDYQRGDRFVVAVTDNGKPMLPLQVWLRGTGGKGIIRIV